MSPWKTSNYIVGKMSSVHIIDNFSGFCSSRILLFSVFLDVFCPMDFCSQCFLIEYKKTMKSESPEICESLVKKSEEEEELQDRECLICTDDIGRSFENTVKCDDCKRRYHDDCLSEWLKIKRTCPACSRLMLNRNEFPPLTN
uniref:RING-type domain-containing protein n=1 Tax=Caenorhabditis tropicalis TaxID=1561998 RepID=A0A1I7UIU7_9PELO